MSYERGATTEEETVDDSSLERQTVTMTLSGSFDDIRAFIYTLETSADFVVIDNVVIGRVPAAMRRCRSTWI